MFGRIILTVVYVIGGDKYYIAGVTDSKIDSSQGPSLHNPQNTSKYLGDVVSPFNEE